MHNEFIQLAIQELDRPLEPGLRRQLAGHLDACESCRAEVAVLRGADEGLRHWGSEPPPVPVSPPAVGRAPVPALSNRLWPPLLAAGLVGLLAGTGGYVVGKSRAPDGDAIPGGTAAGAAFTLFLEEPQGSWPPVAPDMRPGYVEWRDSLIGRGRFLGGDRFSPDGGWYVARGGAAQPAESTVTRGNVNYSGYFVIRARDYAEAVRIARSSPHLRFGGILVRRTY